MIPNPGGNRKAAVVWMVYSAYFVCIYIHIHIYIYMYICIMPDADLSFASVTKKSDT